MEILIWHSSSWLPVVDAPNLARAWLSLHQTLSMHLSSSSRACFNVTSLSTFIAHSELAELHTIVGRWIKKGKKQGKFEETNLLFCNFLFFDIARRYIGESTLGRGGSTRFRAMKTVDPRRRRLTPRSPRGMRFGALTHWLDWPKAPSSHAPAYRRGSPHPRCPPGRVLLFPSALHERISSCFLPQHFALLTPLSYGVGLDVSPRRRSLPLVGWIIFRPSITPCLFKESGRNSLSLSLFTRIFSRLHRDLIPFFLPFLPS